MARRRSRDRRPRIDRGTAGWSAISRTRPSASHDPNLIYASVLTAKPAALAERANKMRAGSAFIYHCSEGQRGTIVAREFTDAEAGRLPAAAIRRGARQCR